jgi:hypothetical protein
MAVLRIEIPSDRSTARRVLKLHLAGQVHRETRDAARDRVWRLGRTPAGEPVFVGVSEGEPVGLLYEVEVHSDTVG